MATMDGTPIPTLMPLGDRALVVRFAESLDMAANQAAIALAARCSRSPISGVLEVAPNLVSVLLRYDPAIISYAALCGEIRLLAALPSTPRHQGEIHSIPVHYGGDNGPDLASVAQVLALDRARFVARHTERPLDVLAVGFAPGFLYCGLHDEDLAIARRQTVRTMIPAGSILFAAGQTAIAATPIPTGWSVIGRTGMINFRPEATPPIAIKAGDRVRFVEAP